MPPQTAKQVGSQGSRDQREGDRGQGTCRLTRRSAIPEKQAVASGLQHCPGSEAVAYESPWDPWIKKPGEPSAEHGDHHAAEWRVSMEMSQAAVLGLRGRGVCCGVERGWQVCPAELGRGLSQDPGRSRYKATMWGNL